MVEVQNSVNEYGTPITIIECVECGDMFSICPAIPSDEWNNLYCNVCESYNPNFEIVW